MRSQKHQYNGGGGRFPTLGIHGFPEGWMDGSADHEAAAGVGAAERRVVFAASTFGVIFVVAAVPGRWGHAGPAGVGDARGEGLGSSDGFHAALDGSSLGALLEALLSDPVARGGVVDAKDGEGGPAAILAGMLEHEVEGAIRFQGGEVETDDDVARLEVVVVGDRAAPRVVDVDDDVEAVDARDRRVRDPTTRAEVRRGRPASFPRDAGSSREGVL